MSRAKSVILSAAEKKNVVVGLKTSIKTAKASVASLATVRKDADKSYAVATKAHLATLKANDKLVVAANKELAALTAQLATLTAPTPAVATA